MGIHSCHVLLIEGEFTDIVVADGIAQRFICRCPLIALSDLVQHFTADSSFVLLCLHREEGGTQNKQ